MASLEHQFIPYSAVDCIGHGRILVLAPHPDDEVFGCGGAIIRHVEAGDPVQVVIVTDGAYVASGTAGDYALTRQQEGTAAAIVLGYGAPAFWALPDRSLEYGEFLIQRILTSIDEDQPDIVYAPSWWEIHPDHLALAMATVEAVRRSRRPLHLAMYEVGVPLHPNTLLDITDIVERKQAAVACFSSQLAQQRYDQHIGALNRFRTYTLLPTVGAAEAYRLVTQEELTADPLQMIRPGVYYGQTRRHADAAPPLVSVIVRSMDRPQLADALDSIALQTYQNIEIVLVNAKGEDHSAISDWRGRFPVRLISSQSPLSRARAANVGLHSARGDYIAFLDDDDIFYPDHVAALVLALCDSNSARVAYAGVRVDYFVDGKVTRSGEFRQAFDVAQLRGRNYIPNNAVLFEKSLCEMGCRFDESLAVLEDWDFLLQLSLHSTFHYLDQVSACHRNHGHSRFGHSIRDDYLLKTTAAVFDKWKSAWSGEQLAEMILQRDAVSERCERKMCGLQDELSARERLYHEQEQEKAVLQAEFVAHEPLLARLAELEEDLTHHRHENSMLRMELACRDSSIADAASAIAGLTGTINDLRRSTSWRITKPMRSVVALLRRRRH